VQAPDIAACLLQHPRRRHLHVHTLADRISSHWRLAAAGLMYVPCRCSAGGPRGGAPAAWPRGR
jgi:hypothetical protein